MWTLLSVVAVCLYIVADALQLLGLQQVEVC